MPLIKDFGVLSAIGSLLIKYYKDWERTKEHEEALRCIIKVLSAYSKYHYKSSISEVSIYLIVLTLGYFKGLFAISVDILDSKWKITWTANYAQTVKLLLMTYKLLIISDSNNFTVVVPGCKEIYILFVVYDSFHSSLFRCKSITNFTHLLIKK